ncbi:MAG: TolC family protein [Treponema sp.]|jgi:multidrug efflux system outer membrane protein|nr:TolC family protein [Treponema sp.]
MNRVPRLGILSIIALCFGFPVFAGAVESLLIEMGAVTAPLSLEKAVELALDQSLSLQKSSIDLQTAKFSSSNLWAEIFPRLSAGGGLSYGTPLLTQGGFQTDPDLLNYNLTMGITFSLTPSLASSMKILKLAYQSQLLDYENSRRQLEIQVAKTFYSLIAEKRNLENLENTLAQAQRQLERNQVAFNNGMVSQIVYLQSRYSAENARLNLSRAETAYDLHRGEFFVLLGLDRKSGIELEGEISITLVEAEPERLIAEYLPKRPDMISQRQTIERLELTQRQSVLNARAPSLTLSGQWRGGAGITPGNFTDSLSASLSVDIPIVSWIPGTTENQTVRTARANVEKAELDLKNTENLARLEIQSLSDNLHNSWLGIEIDRLQVEIAERTYELSEQGFRNGTVESLTLEENRNRLAQAQQQLLNDELSYMNMILDLAAAVNIDPDELRKPPGPAAGDPAGKSSRSVP